MSQSTILESRSAAELQDHLDVLWEKYLTLLDQYQQAQHQLSQHFSSGFISLAQANFTSPSHIRYGKDYYDARMQASRRLAITREAERSVAKKPDPLHSTPIEQRETDAVKPPEPSQAPTPPTTPPPSDPIFKTNQPVLIIQTKTTPPPPTDAADTTPPPTAKDPLRWFGILSPPALRTTQRSFIAALQDPVLSAVNAARAMRGVEGEIRRVRKEVRRAERAGSGSGTGVVV
ncbi:hypothetical protein LTR50_003236 [Elasticomyces elasticus]|nr:hypothetical protein LTR50_003236 [Elasticomyces elasticus]